MAFFYASVGRHGKRYQPKVNLEAMMELVNGGDIPEWKVK